MKLLILIACAIVVLLLIIYYIIFCAKLRFCIKVNNTDIKMYWKKSVIYDLRNNFPQKNSDNQPLPFEEKYKRMKYIINFLRTLLDDENDDIIYILKYAKRTFSVKRLDISLDYGFDDAALTGITGGIIWTLIAGLSGFVGRYIDFKKFTNIAVKPYYTEEILEFKLDLFFDVSLYNFMKTIRHIKRFKKTLKGRR